MALRADLERIARAAHHQAAPGEEVAGVIPTKPAAATRVYLCAFQSERQGRTWLAIDEHGEPVAQRALVRAAVSIAALCELAEESAGGGKLDELRAELVSIRLTENPEGIEEAEEAALALERTISGTMRVASPEYLDAIGAATRRLERALGEGPGSPFAKAMERSTGAVEELEREVLGSYKGELR